VYSDVEIEITTMGRWGPDLYDSDGALDALSSVIDEYVYCVHHALTVGAEEPYTNVDQLLVWADVLGRIAQNTPHMAYTTANAIHWKELALQFISPGPPYPSGDFPYAEADREALDVFDRLISSATNEDMDDDSVPLGYKRWLETIAPTE